MAVFTLTPEDLAPFAVIDEAKAQVMITDAMALAVTIAPCLANPDLDEGKAAAAKAIVRGAIMRWNDAGTGALASQNAGPFGVTLDTRQTSRNIFYPSEVEQLRAICKGQSSGAFAIDTAPVCDMAAHAPVCSLRFGALYCSCGADIAGTPIYGSVD